MDFALLNSKVDAVIGVKLTKYLGDPPRFKQRSFTLSVIWLIVFSHLHPLTYWAHLALGHPRTDVIGLPTRQIDFHNQNLWL